jgi:hypothetical protein
MTRPKSKRISGKSRAPWNINNFTFCHPGQVLQSRQAQQKERKGSLMLIGGQISPFSIENVRDGSVSFLPSNLRYPFFEHKEKSVMHTMHL